MSHTKMKLLTTAEAAKELGFNSRTIARWCREGKIDAVKLGRVWRVKFRGNSPLYNNYPIYL